MGTELKPNLEPDASEDVMKRLRRIEGQVRGVEKMLDEGRDCREILQQLAAIKSAVQQASLTIARSYACQCLATADDGKSQEQIVDDLLTVLSKT
jgi:DNA-binding FrmR family transcriptional regulator